MTRIEEEQLSELYKAIHDCRKYVDFPGCNIKYDRDRVPRKLIPDTLNSKVFMVGQALAKQTQRLSGIPYTKPTGSLRPAGNTLEKHLNKIGYCMPHPGNDSRQMVYSSDIVQCYPEGNKEPKRKAVTNCLHWLESEIEMIKPKVIVLLGAVAARAVLERYCHKEFKRLREVLLEEFNCVVNGRETYMYALLHTALRVQNSNPDFDSIYCKTFRLIKERLSCDQKK